MIWAKQRLGAKWHLIQPNKELSLARVQAEGVVVDWWNTSSEIGYRVSQVPLGTYWRWDNWVTCEVAYQVEVV